jgi:hypothetical protein
MNKYIHGLVQLLLGFGLILLLLALMQCMAQAQSNPFQTGLDAAVNNGAIGGGAWRSTTGDYTIYSYDYLFNITPGTNALGAGLIIGGDCVQSGHADTWNDVKGGFAVNYQFNLGAIGLTNAVFKVYGGNAVATPRNSDVGVGNITFVGVDWSVDIYKRIVLHISPAYQTRTGQGDLDRNYAGIQAFISLGGGTASLLAANDRYLKYAYASLNR